MNRKSLLLITIFSEGGLLLFGLALMRFSRFAFWPGINISWSATMFALILSLPLLVLLFLFDRLHWEPMSRFRREVDEKVVPIFVNSKLPDLLLIALLAGVSEELFFRGWLQGLLTDRFGILLGILITSLIFGLAHYLSTTYAIYAGLTGIYLGVIYFLSGNLFLVMTIHALYDFIALVYLQKKGESGETKHDMVEVDRSN